MSKNRDRENDRKETKKLILNPNRPIYTGGENWLGHGKRGAKASHVDALLLDGATMAELLEQRDAIYQHFAHLRIEHGLLYEKIGETYRFDREALGIVGQQERKGKPQEEHDGSNIQNKFLSNSPSDNLREQTWGAGFGDPETNRRVEQAAICFVTKWYQARGWTVYSVEAEKCGFDLRCVLNADEKHIEVKGIQGNGQSFTITASEARCADHDPRFTLCIVTSALSGQPIMHQFTGKQFLASFDLQPLAFKASLKG
jgi:hypothetical protein